MAALCNTAPYAVLASGVVAAAHHYRGPRVAAVTAAVIVVPNAVSQALKVITAEDRVNGPLTPAVHVAPESWPSGHATASLTLVLCAIAIAPAVHRMAVAAAGLGFAGIVGLAVTGLGWHFPSDVVGGYLDRDLRRVPSRRAARAARPARSPPGRG